MAPLLSTQARQHRWPELLLALTLAVLCLTSSPVITHADTWHVAKGYSEVRFSWDNMGLSRQSARFADVDGSINFSPTDPAGGSVEIRIRTASVQTAAREFDDLLRRPEFFDAVRFPYITFKSTAVRQTGPRTGEVIGDLTVRGGTQPVVLDVTWNFTGEHPLAPVNPTYLGTWVSGFSAKSRLKRSAWGLDRGLPLVSDDIDVAIEIEFTRKTE
jgi:polyisoprenoid-binding protein YceI